MSRQEISDKIWYIPCKEDEAALNDLVSSLGNQRKSRRARDPNPNPSLISGKRLINHAFAVRSSPRAQQLNLQLLLDQ